MKSTLRSVSLGEVQSFAAVSDVHLRNPEDVNTQIFVNFLKNLANVDVLFCLGDIFDFIFAGNTFYVHYWSIVFSAFSDLKNRGILIVFLEGNHDYGFEHFLHPSLKNHFLLAADAQACCTHPVLGKVILRHGDDIVCPPQYLLFRELVKSRLLQKMLSPVTGRFTHWVFNAYAILSRKKSSRHSLNAGYFWDRVKKFLMDSKTMQSTPDVLIFGHVHQHVHATAFSTKVLVGQDWLISPNILFVNQFGEIRRTYLTSKGSDPWTEVI